jgi:hypothetical protein
MITNADPGRPIFLSVSLKDGSMDAFDEIQDAVAHATVFVKDEDTERLIFVAMPRARVRMAVRVDPIEAPSPLPTPAQPSEPPSWEKSQGLMSGSSNGHDQARF